MKEGEKKWWFAPEVSGSEKDKIMKHEKYGKFLADDLASLLEYAEEKKPQLESLENKEIVEEVDKNLILQEQKFDSLIFQVRSNEDTYERLNKNMQEISDQITELEDYYKKTITKKEEELDAKVDIFVFEKVTEDMQKKSLPWYRRFIQNAIDMLKKDDEEYENKLKELHQEVNWLNKKREKQIQERMELIKKYDKLQDEVIVVLTERKPLLNQLADLNTNVLKLEYFRENLEEGKKLS
ncbi:hypothetical protein A2645_00630 [Candidatus Nomurabacteria bacterium RIFCSPHIGHO2_01_FULL_39_9]|uniref:Uncharacterized protein n=1 Tax=Candidatus Nomurabacteria bacterium RIFCSPHIGHO2_01_FULL_39_9 TaxID=1801735 RepID=A0A1F6UVF2_9BACT|nr:MAG: hypothetical protein A2645_00630 [Candidatus Nomurabacteria bacterium RIFCSPHIGHO2_01_FULL_39_9]